MTLYSTFAKLLGATLPVAAIAATGGNALAASFNWVDVGWDPSITASGTTFFDVDGSGVDVTVSYSDNMWDGIPDLYDASHPAGMGTYDGSLRFTGTGYARGDLDGPSDSTFVTLEFSQDINIDQLWAGSLSNIRGSTPEWMSVSAYSANEDLVAATKYGTYEDFFGNTGGSYNPKADADGLVNLDPDTSDYIYTTEGVGIQEAGNTGDYGRVFFEYAAAPVRKLTFEHFMTESARRSSVAIGSDIQFSTPSEDVPEPASVVAVLAVGALGWRLRRSSRA